MAKSFKGYVPIEVPEFELESPDGERKISVRCVGMLPGSRFLDFMSKISDDSPAEMAKAIYELLQAAINPDQWLEFRAFIDNPDNGVSMEMLSEITGYLGELYSNRPTQPSRLSAAG